MSELVLEVGKTYVFKDEECKRKYLTRNSVNQTILNRFYKDGFILESTDHQGRLGCIEGNSVINYPELRFFKLKEESSQDLPKERNKLQQLLTRVEALEKLVQETPKVSAPLGQFLLNLSNTGGRDFVDLKSGNLQDIREAIDYLSNECEDMYNIFYLALFPENNGKYSGSIYQSKAGSGADDTLWCSFDEITL